MTFNIPEFESDSTGLTEEQKESILALTARLANILTLYDYTLYETTLIIVLHCLRSNFPLTQQVNILPNTLQTATVIDKTKFLFFMIFLLKLQRFFMC